MAATKKTTTAKAVKPVAKKAAPAKKVPAKKAAPVKKAAAPAAKKVAPAKKAAAPKVPATSGASKTVSLNEGWYQRGFKPEPFVTPSLAPAVNREPETRVHGFVMAKVKERFEQRVKAAYSTQAIVLTQQVHAWLKGKVDLGKVAESPRRSGVVGDDLARISVDIPTVLQRKFKAECAERGLTVTQVLGALVNDWTAHYKNYV
ncbi:plasmid partition protein ParG [Paraburkholderia sp. C35]|uniref:plasmid partition protein ParG n=1 Tax=Paraburkholderia sp. C35 TaxID=2126993 RepID=UPI000D68B382|nr:plasmid partition protein ParG [Paraburkholderia sp. C35]